LRSPAAPGPTLTAPDAACLAAGPVPETARGRWCLFQTGPLDHRQSVPFVELLGPDGHAVGDRWFLAKRPRLAGGGCWAIGHISHDAGRFRVAAMGRVPAEARAQLRIRPINPALAALLLAAGRPASLPRLLRPGARRALAELATARCRPDDYGLWIRCFEPATPDRHAAGPSLCALVFHPAAGGPAPLAATLGSLGPMPHCVVRDSSGWADAAALEGEYVAILQAGEVLPPHTAWLAPAELGRLGRPAIATADMDELDAGGARRNPQFRPEPNHALMLSGTLSQGLWLVRRDALAPHFADPAPGWAELLRLDLWLRRYERGAPDSRRIPYVLSHRRPDTAAAPPARLAVIADAHLRRSAIPLRPIPAFPLRLRTEPATPARIGIVVPSALRSPHTPGCILELLAGTAHRAFELVVVVAQPAPLDAAQQEAAARIAADPRARVVHVSAGRFNFSHANNQAVALLARGDVCFVNDDVTPLAPDWLDHMAAHLADPRIGIVGARLQYSDGSLQHGGVIMGVGGRCEHAHRHLPAGEPGYAWRATVAQEFSAVTAACMLVRRGVFEALGGLDEAYASAYNDIDFCLRAREAGHGVVLAAGAALVHHELQTYGSHYAGERAPDEAVEIARMQARWAAVIAADPFYSPNLDLAPGREWRPAFPPRPAPP